MKAWEIKYGQIAIGVKNYDLAVKLFESYFDRKFDIETPDGTFSWWFGYFHRSLNVS
jgi:hypothetical protein